MKVLLISGIPLYKKSSFYRQLCLLSSFLKSRGMGAVIAGPFSEQGSRTPIAESAGLLQHNLQSLEDLIRETQANSAILLGYPEQFPFLHRKERLSIPVFLWAQFSRTPGPGALGYSFPVPLTRKTLDFLVKSGYSGIGPIIPHGVDTSVYHLIPHGEQERLKREWGLKERFVIGTVGANTFRKKLDKIIESFSLFCREKDDGFLLVKTDRCISMDGIDLCKLAEKYGVKSRVKIITDDLTECRMCRLYNVMDVYINLSEWEGFCISIIQAMACGIPIVTHPVQGPGEIVPYDDLMVCGSEVIREEDTVLLHADQVEAARVILKASKDPILLRSLSKKVRREAEKRYDIRIVARLWDELISAYYTNSYTNRARISALT